MTSEQKSTAQLVGWRLMELMDHRTPWHRGLWQVGTIDTLHEVLEYAQGAADGPASPQGLEYVCDRALVRLSSDEGLSPALVALAEPLLRAKGHKKDGLINPRHADALRELIRRGESTYLSLWAERVAAQGVERQDVEKVARAAGAHLLDQGFSADHIHGWLRSSLSGKGTGLPDLLAKAASMCAEEPRHFEAVVPFQRLPPEVIRVAHDRFLDREQLSKYCSATGVDVPKFRGPGALIFGVTARDPQGAVEAVADTVRRLASRAAVGLSKAEVATSGEVLVSPGKRNWRPLTSWRKELMVPSLVRRSLLLPESSEATALDDAFELLAAVETSTSWASVAASWAAVEGLLARPGESGVSAADALADIVACSFPRAELTGLMESLSHMDVAISAEIRSAATQAERIAITLAGLRANDLPPMEHPADEAAVVRMQLMANDPLVVLDRVRNYFSDAFRRLYNQRNLVMHRGSSTSRLMPATLRTSPPLVAAGVDRLVNAEVNTPQVSALELATRAAASLQLAQADDLGAMLD
ncbi:hypothetical protein AAII07_01035 [Microvirga sp. 0TCS3.31]